MRLIVAAWAALFLLACAAEQPAPTTTEPASATEITLYSGRNEKLIQPLIDRFQQETGTRVNVRYGETSELAATLLEEGDRSPADLFLSQDAAALGAVQAAGLFQPLPADLLARVPERFRSAEGRWIGVSGRARTVVYNPSKLQPAQLPQSLRSTTEPRWKGRFGIAPTNASFQAHMAVYSVVNGKEALQTLLAGIAANDPKRYPNNGSVVRAVADGEIDWGLVNHYYAFQLKRESPELPVENFFMPEGEVSSFVNLAGAGVVRAEGAGIDLLRYMLNDESQRYFAEQTSEYPLVEGVPAAAELTPLSEVRSPNVDFAQAATALPETLELINQSGLIQ